MVRYLAAIVVMLFQKRILTCLIKQENQEAEENESDRLTTSFGVVNSAEAPMDLKFPVTTERMTLYSARCVV